MQMYRESENPYFSCTFFNMDISLIIAPISLKMCMCIAETYMEGSVSQNFDLGLVFVLCNVEEGIFEKEIQKITKVTCFFYHKIKIRA